MSPEWVCQRGRGRSSHVDGLKTEKAQEPTAESGVRNLEAESIRSRVESMGGCVKLKTVTEIRQSSDCDTFIAEGVYFCTEFFVGLEASGEIETEVLCDQFCSFFSSMRRAAQFCITTIRTSCESSLWFI